MKSILMSIQSKWLAKILDGEKTIELRKRFPKDFRGWVYLYCTKDKKQPLASFRFIEGWRYRIYGNNTYYSAGCTSNIGNDVNGKVVCRFWVDKVDTIIRSGMGYYVEGQDRAYTNRLANQSCLTFDDLQKYFGDEEGRAIHISKLEIFDKPKELAEFHYYKKRLIDCGRDCPPYFDEVKTQVRKAPQSWQYIYIEEVI